MANLRKCEAPKSNYAAVDRVGFALNLVTVVRETILHYDGYSINLHKRTVNVQCFGGGCKVYSINMFLFPCQMVTQGLFVNCFLQYSSNNHRETEKIKMGYLTKMNH